ncbi:hypothetical protein EON65_10500 [archaeon]|nr:MAG: hypothetical protein EON65_10500 [archaeon]
MRAKCGIHSYKSVLDCGNASTAFLLPVAKIGEILVKRLSDNLALNSQILEILDHLSSHFSLELSEQMVSYAGRIGYLALLLSLCYFLYYLLTSPSILQPSLPQGVSSTLSTLFNSNPIEIQHHPLAEHANTLTESLFNSFTVNHRIFSPLGIAYSLAVVQEAAANQTALELSRVLGGQYTYDDLRRIQNVFHEQNDSMLNIVTYWSIHHNSSVHPSFIQENKGICTISKDNYADALRVSHKINQVFAENTHNHINSAAKAIRTSTSSVLINTLYFQAYWKEAFDPRLTRPANFTQFVGTKRATGMMRKRAIFNYYQSPSVQLVEIPYNNSAYVMGVLLPSHVQNAEAHKVSLNFTTLMEQIGQLKETDVEVWLPKFKHKKMVRAHVNLRALGVKAVFDPKKAELPRLGPQIYLTEMVHDIIFMADELGSNSDRNALNQYVAQATMVKGATKAKPLALPAMRSRVALRMMRCDHAFIYYVRHLPTNTIILIADFDSP